MLLISQLVTFPTNNKFVFKINNILTLWIFIHVYISDTVRAFHYDSEKIIKVFLWYNFNLKHFYSCKGYAVLPAES